MVKSTHIRTVVLEHFSCLNRCTQSRSYKCTQTILYKQPIFRTISVVVLIVQIFSIFTVSLFFSQTTYLSISEEAVEYLPEKNERRKC